MSQDKLTYHIESTYVVDIEVPATYLYYDYNNDKMNR